MKKDKTKKLKACPRKYRNRKIVGSVILVALCRQLCNQYDVNHDRYLYWRWHILCEHGCGQKQGRR